jgi:branched-chain amino acid transport system substrate-binding protein
MFRRSLSAIFLITFLVFFVFSNGFAKDIKVGVVMPMTGPVASFGQSSWHGIQIAKSLKPKLKDGNKIKLILLDDKSDKIEAANALSRLVSKEHVKAIIGPLTSGNTLSAESIAEKAQIPLLTHSATNPLVTKDKQFISRVCFIDSFQGKVASKYAINSLKAKTAAVVIDISEDYSVGLAKFFMKDFEQMGGKIVAKTFVQTNDNDFSAQIALIKSKNPDIIYMPCFYQALSLFAIQARQFGLKQTILAGDGASEAALIKVGGKSVEGLTFTAHFDPKAVVTDLGKKFIKAYEAKYKEIPSTLAALGADGYFVMLDAINRAGGANATSKEINKAIRHTKNFKGVTGIITIDPKTGNAVKSAVIQKVENGKFVYVTIINP